MKYNLTTPCDQCPFLIGSGFTWQALHGHAAGEFPCHKTCKLDQSQHFVPRNDKTPHCAGALIFLEKQKRPHQMMRIGERLGMYDRTKLDMSAQVSGDQNDYPNIK